MAKPIFARMNAPFAKLVRKKWKTFVRTATVNWCGDRAENPRRYFELRIPHDAE
jgi:hypothetical protein